MSIQLRSLAAPENIVISPLFTISEVGASLGRLDTNDICLPADEHISKQHALIQMQEGLYFLTDVSTNGVFMNDSKIPLNHTASARAQLHHLDKVRMGNYVFEVIFPEITNAPQTSATLDIESLLGAEAGKPIYKKSADFQESIGSFTADDLYSQFGTAQTYQQANQQIGTLDIDDFLSGNMMDPAVDQNQSTSADEEVSASDPDWFKQDSSLSPETDLEIASVNKKAPVKPVMTDMLWPILIETLGLDQYQVLDQSTFVRELAELLLLSISCMQKTLREKENQHREMGAETTLFQPSKNNPLKFSASPSEALSKLLLDRTGAYLTIDEAVPECFNDITEFQTNLFKAAQKAVQQQLSKFSPQQLQSKFMIKKSSWLSRSSFDIKAFSDYYQRTKVLSQSAVLDSIKELYHRKILMIAQKNV